MSATPSSHSPSLFLFIGPDRAGKLQRVHRLAQTWRVDALDFHHLDGGALDAATLMTWCRQQPAASACRLIVIDDAHRLDPACAEALIQQAAVIAGSARVLLLVEAAWPARHPLANPPEVIAVERFPDRGGEPAAKPFALTDALGASDLPGACVALQEQLATGKEPLEVLGLVGWQLTRWVTTRRWLDQGAGAERISAMTGWKPWYVRRLSEEVERRPLAALQRLLLRCWQLDVDAKRGRILPQMAIEQLITEVCVGDPQEIRTG